jgi:hypothetical protein
MPTTRDLLIVHHSPSDIGYANFQDTVFALQRDYLRRTLDLAEQYADGAPRVRVCPAPARAGEFPQRGARQSPSGGLKPAADGRGMIARLQELAGQASDFQLRFDLCYVLSAERCDLIESTEGAEPLTVTKRSVSGHIEPYRLQTIRIVLKG